MTKTKKNLIDYLYADEGGIVFCSGSVLNQVGFDNLLKSCLCLENKRYRDEIRHSSSMDFASEYGFKKNGDAWVMFDTALEMIGLDFNIIVGVYNMVSDWNEKKMVCIDSEGHIY